MKQISAFPLNVWHFSGGRSSAKMVIDGYKDGDLVIFCDTGREHPKTYKFINDFEAFENIPVIRLQLRGGWLAMLKAMCGIPNRVMRKCTILLKIKTARRYLRSIGYKEYTQHIGYRADEPYRIAKYWDVWQEVTTKFPLAESAQTKEMIAKYFNSKSYHLEIPSILGNCDLCFMKGVNNIIAILTNDPDLANKWILDEANDPNGYTYINGITYKEMLEKALRFRESGKIIDLENLIPDLNCACSA